MFRHLTRVLVALVTFNAGLAFNALVNHFGDTIVEQCSDFTRLARVAFDWREPQLLSPPVNTCSLVVTIGTDRSLLLNSRRLGSLEDPGALGDRLRHVFYLRTELHVYRQGMETAYEVPALNRIDRAVYLKAPGSIPYREVARLIRLLSEAGADPILLVDVE